MSERLKRGGGAAAADEEQALRALLSHSDGARGFYVTTLTAPDLQNVTLPRPHPEHHNTREKERARKCLGAHAGSARCT